MRRGIISGTTLACLVLWACDPVGPGRGEPSAADPNSIARGGALFLEYCALCHGVRGDGAGVRRGSLSRSPANFRSPIFVPDRTRVRRAIHDGIAGSDMPGWQRLGEPAIDDLTSYVLSLTQSSR